MPDRTSPPTRPPYLTGMLAWILPGAGHWYLGMRARGVIVGVTVALLFWTGVAIGGLRTTVDPQKNTHWFLGQICSGSHAIVALAINRAIPWRGEEGKSYLKSRDIAVVYAGVAGLLNLLAVFDAIVRSISGNVREEEPDKDSAGRDSTGKPG